ncbi:MAG: hypothetical protein RLZZ627_1931, partial [Pseudomonadota bacterium]
EVQHDRGVLADGVEHDGAVKLSGDFSDYMDALSLKLLEVGQFVVLHGGVCDQASPKMPDIGTGKHSILT